MSLDTRTAGGDDWTFLAGFCAGGKSDEEVESDARRPQRDRRTALKLFAELKGAGFGGDYSRVTEFVRRWRAEGRQAKVHAYVPLRFELGEA